MDRSAKRKKLTRQKRLILSRADEVAFNQFVARIARQLGTRVRFSHILRACIMLLLHSEREILQQARVTRLHRPPNEETDALADFDRQLARVLLAALKRSSRLR